MNVHEAISKHSNQQYTHLQKFLELDELREQYIADAIFLYKNNQNFSVQAINQVTALINKHAEKGISPTRKYITEDFVKQFVEAHQN